MMITGKNLKGNVAKGIFSLGAFLTIYRIDLDGLPFTDKLRGLVTGQLRAFIESVRLLSWSAASQIEYKDSSYQNT
jgi:hypothetical protein